MNCRSALVLALAVVCCGAPSALAQFKAKGKKATADSKVQALQRPAPDEPDFLLSLEESAKPRKVFMPVRPEAGGAPREPGVTTIVAMRVIRGDEPPMAYLLVTMYDNSSVNVRAEDVGKIIQFKKDFQKRVAPVPEHVESASLTLRWSGLYLNFKPRTGECWYGQVQVPDGFFEALSDALGDLEKLKAAKPSFQVSEPKP
jgi:hypothetical protein